MRGWIALLVVVGCSSSPEVVIVEIERDAGTTMGGGSQADAAGAAGSGEPLTIRRRDASTVDVGPDPDASTDASALVDASDAGSVAPLDATPAVSDAGTDGCEPSLFWPDRDGDGYGDASASQVVMCGPSAGFSTTPTDCYDDNAQAHPGAVGWWPEDRGDGSFDYDCDGVEEHRWTGTATCEERPPAGGWRDLEQDCGATDAWFRTYEHPTIGLLCEDAPMAWTQECR